MFESPWRYDAAWSALPLIVSAADSVSAPVSLAHCAAEGKNVHVFCESGLTAAPNLSVALWRPVSVSPVEPALFEESASEACCV